MSIRLRPLHLMLAALSVSAGLLLTACAPATVAPPKAPSQPQAQAPAPLTPATPPPVSQQPLVPQAAKVALLLPLSGQNGAVGRGLMQAAEMGVFDSAGDDFSLVVRDSATVGGPGNAVRSALGEGVGLVLGPVFATEVPAAASAVQTASGASGPVPVISFSNDRSAAKPGVFVLGLAPQAQVERVVDYAAGQGLKRFAILYPSSAYGNAVRQAYQDAVVAAGGQVALMQGYDPAASDLVATIQTLSGSFKSAGFDALMIPEGGAKLRTIAAMLPGFDIPVAGPGAGPSAAGTVRLLGTGLWNDPALAQEHALAGGWFATTPPDRWRSFVQRYQQVYGAPPDPRAGIIYDAVTLAVALAKARPGGDFGMPRLTDPSGFAGVTGLFRLNADGTSSRGLAVLEIGPGGITVRDPAPTSFQSVIN